MQMTFSQWRYRTIEQIVFRTDLAPIARVAAYGIASATNKTSRTTCASPMTIAGIVGETFPEMVLGIKSLERSGQMKVSKRDDGHIDKWLILRRDKMPDHDLTIFGASKTWYKSSAGRDFIEARGRLRDQIFADRSLSPGDKLIGFAVTAVMDIHGCVHHVSAQWIGGLVGIKDCQTRRSITKLSAAGYFEKVNEEGRQLFLTANLDECSANKCADPGTNPGTNPGTSDSKSADKTCINLDSYRNLGDSGNILSKRQIPRQGGVSVSVDILERWQECHSFMTGDFCKAGDRQTIGGIIKLTREYPEQCANGDGNVTADEIYSFIDLGWLRRETYAGAPTPRGKWLSITDAGDRALDEYEAMAA